MNRMGATAAIVKVVISAPHRVDSVATVFDKEARHVTRQSVSQKVRDAMKGDTRAFFDAQFDGTFWAIAKRVPEQFW